MSHSNPADPHVVIAGADCTIRAIDGLWHLLCQARPSGATLRIDCAGVQQADVTLVQLLAAAQASFAAKAVQLSVDPAPACVDDAFRRAGLRMPGIF